MHRMHSVSTDARGVTFTAFEDGPLEEHEQEPGPPSSKKPKLTPDRPKPDARAEAFFIDVFSLQDTLTPAQADDVAQQISCDMRAVRPWFHRARMSVKGIVDRALRHTAGYEGVELASYEVIPPQDGSVDGYRDIHVSALQKSSSKAGGAGGSLGGLGMLSTGEAGAAVAHQKLLEATRMREEVSKAIKPLVDADGGLLDGSAANVLLEQAAEAKIFTSRLAVLKIVLKTRDREALSVILGSGFFAETVCFWLWHAVDDHQPEIIRSALRVLCMLHHRPHSLFYAGARSPLYRLQQLAQSYSRDADIVENSEELLAMWTELKEGVPPAVAARQHRQPQAPTRLHENGVAATHGSIPSNNVPEEISMFPSLSSVFHPPPHHHQQGQHVRQQQPSTGQGLGNVLSQHTTSPHWMPIIKQEAPSSLQGINTPASVAAIGHTRGSPITNAWTTSSLHHNGTAVDPTSHQQQSAPQFPPIAGQHQRRSSGLPLLPQRQGTYRLPPGSLSRGPRANLSPEEARIAQRLEELRPQVPWRPPPDCLAAMKIFQAERTLPQPSPPAPVFPHRFVSMPATEADAKMRAPEQAKQQRQSNLPRVLPFVPIDAAEREAQRAALMAQGVTMMAYV